MYSKEDALKDVRDYICNEFLNLDDPSVGITAIGSLDENVVKEIEDDWIKVVSFDKESALLNVEGIMIELFINENEKWDAHSK
jgi:hypothetical protein